MKHLYLLLLSCMVISCTEMRTATTLDDCDVVATKKNENLTVCKLDAVKQTIALPFSELFKEWGLVKLENTSKEIMVGPDQRIFISDNYILIWGEKNKDMLLFDKHGKFQRRFGQPGQGPGDIVGQLVHTQIDEANNVVYFSDFNPKRISKYQLSTGKHLGEYPIDIKGMAKFFLDIDKQLLTVACAGKLNDFKICTQKLNGEKVKTIQNNFDEAGWREVFLWNNDDDILYYNYELPREKDSLYHYDISSNKLIPYFSIDFGEKTPDHRYFVTNQYYIGTINDKLEMSPGYTAYPEKWLFIDKHSLKGAYARLVLDRYGDLDVTEVSPCTMFGDYYATILMPDRLEELCRKALLENTDLPAESKEELQELLDNIGEDDNCFVLYGKIN